MRELVPIKVKIGLKSNGQALYPDFNSMNCVMSSGLDWSRYVDIKGLGWHYDKKCGHKDEDSTSPLGIQWGVLIVDKEFADEAVISFPNVVERLSETKLKEFYDNRSHSHELDEDIDVNILQAIKSKQDLGLALTDQQEKALDPEDDTRGIRKNKKKSWDDFKKLKGIKIVK